MNNFNKRTTQSTRIMKADDMPEVFFNMESPLTPFVEERFKLTQIVIPKKDMFLKTQICYNYRFKKECPYGFNCKFAHGDFELQSRIRIQNYKSKPCSDLFTNEGCPFGLKCSYAHPGDSIRAPQARPYFDGDYFKVIEEAHGKKDDPFGVFI